MEKGKIIEAEILLPEAIIQHIQSFLSRKQAAQTSILSKSWYNAWSTRPNLNFDERNFPTPGYRVLTDEFSEFAKKTMQRYHELNLKIESLRLCMENKTRDRHSLASELIVKAVKMGATDLNFKVFQTSALLPHEVLGAETLIRLSVYGCKIDRGMYGKVSCSTLKSLSLRNVYIEGDIICDIISNCPLIEELLLSECWHLVQVQYFNYVTMTTKRLKLALSPFVESKKQNVSFGLVNLNELHKLKSLLLKEVYIDAMFFHDFSSKFPCLKDLTLHYCPGYEEIQIFSRSLECISIVQTRVLAAEFNVPSIHKFTYSGSDIPAVSFETASREWESHISIEGSHTCTSTSWFIRLNIFLTNLCLSKISLSLNSWFTLKESFDYTRAIQGLPRPVLENLTMHAPSSVCSALLDGFFWSCRPKFITLYWFPKSFMGPEANNDLPEILCNRLIQQLSQNCCIPNRSMFCQSDLEEVNMEYFEETLAEWRPLPWKALLDASASPENKRKIRYQLKWGQ